MSGIQHSPTRRRPIQGMREALEYGVSVFATIAMPAKGYKGSSVGGVVGAGEATFNGDICQLSIFQSGSRTIANIRLASASLRCSALSWPMRTRLSSAGRLMGIPNQWKNGLRQDAIHK